LFIWLIWFITPRTVQFLRQLGHDVLSTGAIRLFDILMHVRYVVTHAYDHSTR
jgi:hypothetical protein